MLLETLWEHPTGYRCYFFSPRDPGARKETIWHKLSAQEIAKKAETGDLYFAPNLFSTKKRESGQGFLSRSVYMDLDIKPDSPLPGVPKTVDEAKNVLKALAHVLHVAPSAIVRSGAGFHVYWIFSRYLNPTEWKPKAAFLKKWVTDMGHVSPADGGVITDFARILRVPGTKHWKTGQPLPVQIVSPSGKFNLIDPENFPSLEERSAKDMPIFEGRLKDLEKLLQSIVEQEGPEWWNDRTNWRNAAFALTSAAGKTAECRALWDKYSTLSEKFDPAEQEKVWNSIDKSDRPDKITVRFLQNIIKREVLRSEDIRETKSKKPMAFDQLVDVCKTLPLFTSHLKYNSFSHKLEWKGALLDDEKILDIRAELGRSEQIRLTTPQVHELALYLAKEHFSYNPLQDWLATLPTWDGRNYIAETGEHLGLSGVELVYWKKFLVGCIARGSTPGLKRDEVFILSGPQGIYKSTLFRTLSPFPEWFRDDAQPSLFKGDKDQILGMYGKWIIELPELDATRKTQAESLRRFFSQQEDHVRPPYARTETRFLRQMVFVGTTNSSEFLNDPAGERRFWPATIRRKSPIDVRWVERIRLQLWAQAKSLVNGYASYCLTESEKLLHESNVSGYKMQDVWEVPVTEFLRDHAFREIRVFDLCVEALGATPDRIDRKMQQRVTDILLKMGWFRRRKGAETWWSRPGDLRAPEFLQEPDWSPRQ